MTDYFIKNKRFNKDSKLDYEFGPITFEKTNKKEEKAKRAALDKIEGKYPDMPKPKDNEPFGVAVTFDTPSLEKSYEKTYAPKQRTYGKFGKTKKLLKVDKE